MVAVDALADRQADEHATGNDNTRPNELYPEHLVAMFYKTGAFDALRRELLNEFRHMPELHQPVIDAIETEYFPRVFTEPHFKRISRKDRPFWVQKIFDKEQEEVLGNCQKQAERWLGRTTADGARAATTTQPLALKHSSNVQEIDLDAAMKDMLAQLRQLIKDRDTKAGGNNRPARSERSESIAIKHEHDENAQDAEMHSRDRNHTSREHSTSAIHLQPPQALSAKLTSHLDTARQPPEPVAPDSVTDELVQVPHKPASIADETETPAAAELDSAARHAVTQPAKAAPNETQKLPSIETDVAIVVKNDPDLESSLSPLSSDDDTSTLGQVEDDSKSGSTPKADPPLINEGKKPASVSSSRKRSAATASTTNAKRVKTISKAQRKQSSPIMVAPAGEAGQENDASRGSEPL
ncbi:hypothetical protein OIV83_005208 [Microbotryomycetes sp. JL201]|nr:hypothetical protein OIV83_005208 [Microbotryomycetes sp. JL201]